MTTTATPRSVTGRDIHSSTHPLFRHSKMKPIRVVQFGVSHEHADGKLATIKALPDEFELVGVVDDRDGTTPRFPLRRPDSMLAGVPILTEEQVWADKTIDAVFVEVTNCDLIPVAERVLAHGLPMHLDKPGGESYGRYAKLRTEAKARGIHIQMGYMYRANPAIQWLTRAVREGIFGEIYSIEADMDHGYGDDEYRRYIGSFQGGILYDLGCHLVDFFVSMFGEPSSARPPVIRDAPGSAPGSRDNGLGILEWDNGTIGLIRSCDRNKAYFPSRRLRINGTNGSVELCPVERFDNQPLKVELSLAESVGGLPAGRQALNLGVQGVNGNVDRYADQLRKFARIVRGEEKEPDDLCEHDLAVQRTILRMCGLSL